jgi:hypothetical protein
MSMTALDLSPEELKKYRPLDAIKKRRAKFSAEITSRRRRAMIAVHKAAKLLKTEFDASEVILFGSLGGGEVSRSTPILTWQSAASPPRNSSLLPLPSSVSM